MDLTRREFLRLATRATAALPLLFTPSACGPIVITTDPDTGLSLGYVSGDVTSDRAIVWLRAEPGSKVALYYGKDPSLADAIVLDPVAVEAESDNTAEIELKGLDAHTVYYYRAALVGKRPGPIGRFVTAPEPDADDAVKFCFSGDTREGYQPFRIMDAIRANAPEFFIHLGDTIYADRGGWTAQRLPEFWAKYRDNRADQASQRLFASVSSYIVWDDHEVANDYEGFHPLASIGRQAFFDYWPVRRNADEPDRLYRSFRWGKGLELFLLDARQYRDHAHGTMLGQEQKRWLLEGLVSSTALFKCVATSVPFWGGGRDRWDGYPRERKEILQWIRDEKVKGVFFISADLHYAAVTRLPGHLGLKEVTTGPMAAPVNVLATGTSERFEFFSNKTFNCGMITIDPKWNKPHANIEIFDEDNRSLYKSTIEIR
jgi:alkaline phosphatase D